jgi:hypothetical protein
VDVPDRVRVGTACGTCSTFTGKSPKLTMETRRVICVTIKQSYNRGYADHSSRTVLRKNPGLPASSLRWRDESCIRECMERCLLFKVRVYRISEVC